MYKPLLLAAVVAMAAAAVCTTDMDCQLNGACTDGLCVCDKGWTNATCGGLDIVPAAVAYGYDNPLEPGMSCWGGGPPTFDAASGKYHMFLTEIAAHCGMSTWGRMSQATHVVSDNEAGPYSRVAMAVPSFTHNVYYAYSPTDKMHLIYSIGEGTAPESCNPYLNCTAGFTPGGHGIHPPPGPWPPSTCPGGTGHSTTIHYSASLDGPWESHILRAGPMPAGLGGLSNPAPYIFPNGTVIMMARGHPPQGEHYNIWLYRADHWNATYNWVKSDGVNGTANINQPPSKDVTEDPTIWKGRRGFHALFHSHPKLTHGWSQDGLSWQWSPTKIGPALPPKAGDTQRPRVTVDSNGDLQTLFVASIPGINGSDASHLMAYAPRT